MRILAITNCFPRFYADTRASWNRQQFLALSKNHQIRLVVPVPFTQRRMPDELREIDWSITGDLRASYPTFWFTPKCFEQHYGAQLLRSIRPAVKRILRDFAPQAVMGCWAHPDGYAAVHIARELGVPALLKVVGSDVLILPRNEKRRPRIAQALQDADGVFAVSQNLVNRVIELGADAQNVHLIPEGIDTDLFRPGNQADARRRIGFSGGPMVLFVGNLLISKGAGVLLKACGILRDHGVPFTCCLVGAGKDKSTLIRMTHALQLRDKVIFAGPRPHAELPDWYQAADLVTLPSFSEGIPNTLREAMSCGRPFVATRVGGIPEISPPNISRLVEPGDAFALANAIEEMLAKPPVVDASVASEFCISWEDSASMIDRVLEDLVASTGTTDPAMLSSVQN